MQVMPLNEYQCCAPESHGFWAMQDSLGGTAQVALIVCCSPATQDASESLSALRFGTRAAGIVNSLQVVVLD
jgi:hypothetical protein